MKVQVLRSFVLPVLLYGCETCTLTRDLRWRLNSFGTRSLQRILGSCWLDIVSIERLLREIQMRCVTCIVRERHLRLYGHVARFPDTDPAHQILSVRESPEWRRTMGPHTQCTSKVSSSCSAISKSETTANTDEGLCG